MLIIVDRRRVDAGPASTFLFGANPDLHLTFPFDADPDPILRFTHGGKSKLSLDFYLYRCQLTFYYLSR